MRGREEGRRAGGIREKEVEDGLLRNIHEIFSYKRPSIKLKSPIFTNISLQASQQGTKQAREYSNWEAK